MQGHSIEQGSRLQELEEDRRKGDELARYPSKGGFKPLRHDKAKLVQEKSMMVNMRQPAAV